MKELEEELAMRLKQGFKAWIGFDANKNEYFVSIIPIEWKKESLLITKIK